MPFGLYSRLVVNGLSGAPMHGEMTLQDGADEFFRLSIAN